MRALQCLLLAIVLFLSSCTSYQSIRYLAAEEDYLQRPNLSFYHYAETTFFSPNDPRRFGVEIEFGGINSKETAELIAREFGGQIETVKREINIGIKEVLGNGKIVYEVDYIDDYKVVGSELGDVTVITEFNETESVLDLSKVNPVTEVITEPIRADKIPMLQKLGDVLKDNGAQGTDEGRPVGIHVTVEMNNGNVTDDMSEFLVDLFRSITNPKNRRENAYSLNVSAERQPYLNYFTEGMIKRVRDKKYKPTMQEFYDDFIYRQTLDLMKLPESGDAWTLGIDQVKRIVLAQDKQLVAEVVKFQPIKFTSLLIKLRPDDPMSKLFHEIEEWIRPMPVLEFREANTDFQIDRAVKRALGTMTLVERHGYVADIDKFMSEYSTIDQDTIKKARAWVKETPDEPYIYRYIIGKNPIYGNPDYDWEVEEYGKDRNVILGHLPEETHGIKPTVLPGESIVFHRRPHHRHSVMGKYNPALVNHNIGQAIEHKYLEYRFWEEFMPGALPETVLLKELKKEGPEAILEALNERFPNGWILKGVFDLATEKQIITNDLDILGEIARYKESDFDEYYRQLQKEFAGEDIEDIIVEIKTHPNYFGWKLSTFFDKPQEVIAQSKVKIETEFRVEVIGGKVLGQGTTVDRYSYMAEANRKKGDPGPKKFDAATIKKVESWTQEIVDSLPDEFRRMTFAFDIALLDDGSMVMIESNPGGNSGFLAQQPESIHALNRRLAELTEEIRANEFHFGLAGESQMTWLRDHIKKWDLEEKEIPDMEFRKDRITDDDFSPVKLRKRHRKLRAYRVQFSPSCYQLMQGLL